MDKPIVKMAMIIASIALVLGVVLLATCFNRQKAVATVDTKAIVHAFSHDLAASSLTLAEQKALSTRFAKCLRSTLARYAHAHHSVIIDKSRALASGTDITLSIENTVAALLRQGGKRCDD